MIIYIQILNFDEGSFLMLNQEEKRCKDFINKFEHFVAELGKDFAELSENNRRKVATELIEFVRKQAELKMVISAISDR
jgi:hypothetical protein